MRQVGLDVISTLQNGSEPNVSSRVLSRALVTAGSRS